MISHKILSVIVFLIVTHVNYAIDYHIDLSNGEHETDQLTNRIYDCEFAVTKCNVNLKCAKLLENYRNECVFNQYNHGADVISFRHFQRSAPNCTVSCRIALIALKRDVIGNEYLNCDCVNNNFCKDLRSKLKRNCLNYDINYNDNLISRNGSNVTTLHTLLSTALLFIFTLITL